MPGENSSPKLILGPLLRYVGETEATIWVETDAPCEVEILDRREPTFTVEEHHYALVRIEGLEPDSFNEYEVRLDGERHWPPADSELPPSAIRTLGGDKPIDVCFGSCRVALPHEEPYVQSKDNHEDGKEYDALRVLATEMIRGEHTQWPEFLFLLGDQVYVDEGSPRTREKIRRRRGTETPPGEEVMDYEEYSWLYEESWSDPLIRWLLSTVSVSMQWDDHDMSDDWNISRSWLQEMRRKSWWHGRATAGIMSYWVYQHLGNLSPRALDEDDLYGQIRGNVHATSVLREFATEVHSTGNGSRWSFCRDLGGTRVIFMDSRAGRVLDEGKRSMVDEDEWEWIVDHATGDFDHLLLATTVPLAALARLPPPRGLERAGLRRGLGRAGGPRRREAAPRRRLRPLGLIRQVVPPTAGAAGGGRVGQARQVARLDRRPLRRCPPRLPGRNRLPGVRDRERDLSGGLLALPQPARAERAAGDPDRFLASLHRRHARAGGSGRHSRSGNALAPGRGPLLRQPGGDAAARRPRGPDEARQNDSGRGRRALPGLRFRASHCLSTSDPAGRCTPVRAGLDGVPSRHGHQAQRRHPSLPLRGGGAAVAAGPPGWSLLDEEGPRRLDDPEGRIRGGERARDCALRELGEELGAAPELDVDALVDLGSVRQKSGKVVEAWAAEGDFDPAELNSNTFAMEWPPRSGSEREFPEVDRAEWFDPEQARRQILSAQAELIDRLLDHLRG